VQRGSGRSRQAESSRSSSAVARDTWPELTSSPHSCSITSVTFRVDTPWTYISAIVSLSARSLRSPRSSACGYHDSACSPEEPGPLHLHRFVQQQLHGLRHPLEPVLTQHFHRPRDRSSLALVVGHLAVPPFRCRNPKESELGPPLQPYALTSRLLQKEGCTNNVLWDSAGPAAQATLGLCGSRRS